jgi:hypothetical protein
VRSSQDLRVSPGCREPSHCRQYKKERSFFFIKTKLETSMKNKLLAILGVAALVLATAGTAVATNYSLWINGRNNPGVQGGNYADFTYWGPAATAAGVNKVSVNWDGASRVADQNFRIRDALDCYCTGDNWCYVAAHRAGNLQIGYAMSLYGGSARTKRTGVVAGGQCGAAAGGGTQTGWTIKWVNVAAGAAGGSELADLGSWAVSDALTSDLKTTTARALYDHNQTGAKWFYMFAGSNGAVQSG